MRRRIREPCTSAPLLACARLRCVLLGIFFDVTPTRSSSTMPRPRRARGARHIRPSMGKRQRRTQISRKKKGACKLSQSSGRHGHWEHHDDQICERELSIWPHWSRDLFTHHAARRHSRSAMKDYHAQSVSRSMCCAAQHRCTCALQGEWTTGTGRST